MDNPVLEFSNYKYILMFTGWQKINLRERHDQKLKWLLLNKENTLGIGYCAHV